MALSINTFSLMTLNIMTLNIMTLSIMTLSITTFIKTTFSITTLNIMTWYLIGHTQCLDQQKKTYFNELFFETTLIWILVSFQDIQMLQNILEFFNRGTTDFFTIYKLKGRILNLNFINIAEEGFLATEYISKVSRTIRTARTTTQVIT